LLQAKWLNRRACSNIQHGFIPFAFDTFGFLAPEAVNILNRVQRIMHSNVVSPKSLYIMFKRMGFVIIRGGSTPEILVWQKKYVHKFYG
jgi:hypothetical protein